MPIFPSSEALYACAATLFDQVQWHDPLAAAAVEKSNLLARLNCTDPAAHILVNGRRRPAQIRYGSSPIRPELEVTLPADVLHGILLGELSLATAVGSGKVVVRGQAYKAVALAGLFEKCRRLYPLVMAEHGLGPSGPTGADAE